MSELAVDSIPSNIPNRDQDLARIKEIISKPGVREVLGKIYKKFQQQPGEQLFYGITADGLVVGVREDVAVEASNPGYFRAIAVDATLLADQIEGQATETGFSYKSVTRYRDGGTTIFPKLGGETVLNEAKDMKNDEIVARYPEGEGMLSYVKFYKITGGFNYPSPMYKNEGVKVGDKPIYPLDLS